MDECVPLQLFEVHEALRFQVEVVLDIHVVHYYVLVGSCWLNGVDGGRKMALVGKEERWFYIL